MCPYSAFGVFTASTVSNALTLRRRRFVTIAGAAPSGRTSPTVPSGA